MFALKLPNSASFFKVFIKSSEFFFDFHDKYLTENWNQGWIPCSVFADYGIVILSMRFHDKREKYRQILKIVR